MKRLWAQTVIKNFDQAAINYNDNAKLQFAIAWRLAKLCSQKTIPKGLWVDLGAGTGLLADALESRNPNQKVLRIDGSRRMLSECKSESSRRVWDLNLGLPSLESVPTLLASSFALHWLENPEVKLKEWFYALASGGFLALAVPVKGSFPEWRKAANHAEVPFTALSLPSQRVLLKEIPQTSIQYLKILQISQSGLGVPSLLKTIQRVGGQTSTQEPLGIAEWRRLNTAWAKSIAGKVTLTWHIQIALLKK